MTKQANTNSQTEPPRILEDCMGMTHDELIEAYFLRSRPSL